ncbi:hypothetical protein [Streptomyces sp. SAS_270]
MNPAELCPTARVVDAKALQKWALDYPSTYRSAQPARTHVRRRIVLWE